MDMDVPFTRLIAIISVAPPANDLSALEQWPSSYSSKIQKEAHNAILWSVLVLLAIVLVVVALNSANSHNNVIIITLNNKL